MDKTFYSFNKGLDLLNSESNTDVDLYSYEQYGGIGYENVHDLIQKSIKIDTEKDTTKKFNSKTGDIFYIFYSRF